MWLVLLEEIHRTCQCAVSMCHANGQRHRPSTLLTDAIRSCGRKLQMTVRTTDKTETDDDMKLLNDRMQEASQYSKEV